MGPSLWREGVETELTKWPGGPRARCRGIPRPPTPGRGAGGHLAFPGQPGGEGAAARPPLGGPCVAADTKGQCQC